MTSYRTDHLLMRRNTSTHDFDGSGSSFTLPTHSPIPPPRSGGSVASSASHNGKISSPFSSGGSQRHRRRRARNRTLWVIVIGITLTLSTFYIVFVTLMRRSSSSSSAHDTPTTTRNAESPKPKQGGKPFESTFGGAVNPGYFLRKDTFSEDGTSFQFAAITDMDKLSVVPNARRPTFRASLLPGTLHFHKAVESKSKDKTKTTTAKPSYTVSFGKSREITTTLNEAGRGAEYSELTLFDNRLITYDDRTGAIVELLNHADGQSTFPVTRYVLSEGNGDTLKGMKWEWATVKDDELYVGGIGKEMQLSDGRVDTEDAMWIAKLGKDGQLRREDWSQQYNFVRNFLGCQLPGYMAHEAIEWSYYLRKWIFLPRRVSQHQYVPDLDERLGSNKVIVVNESFTHAKVIEIDLQHHEAGLRGFSSFSFVPRSHDHHVVALRSVEEDCVGDNPHCQFKTYICVFELLTGDVLMEETLIDQPVKFEGIEFVDLFTKPPPRGKNTSKLRAGTKT